MAEGYGHDNLGESPPRFDFSIIDYSVMNRSQLKIGFCRCVEVQRILSKYLKASPYLNVLIPQGNVVIN